MGDLVAIVLSLLSKTTRPISGRPAALRIVRM
jgi:hypothetical protein